jgi:hypothetical protein
MPFQSLMATPVAKKGSVKKEKTHHQRRMTNKEVAHILEKAGFPTDIVPIVTCLAEYESSFLPHVVNSDNANKTKDHGLLQINDIWMKVCRVNATDLKDPLTNAKCARQIYEKQGLTAWVTYKKYKNICLNYSVPGQKKENLAETLVQNAVLM